MKLVFWEVTRWYGDRMTNSFLGSESFRCYRGRVGCVSRNSRLLPRFREYFGAQTSIWRVPLLRFCSSRARLCSSPCRVLPRGLDPCQLLPALLPTSGSPVPALQVPVLTLDWGFFFPPFHFRNCCGFFFLLPCHIADSCVLLDSCAICVCA